LKNKNFLVSSLLSVVCYVGIGSLTEALYPSFAVTLSQTLDLGLNNSQWLDQQRIEVRRLYWEQEAINETFVTSKLSSKLLKSRNQVADPQDPTATASDKQTRRLAYTQDFRSGVQWSVSHYNREESPISGVTTKDSYSSNILDINGAIWGKRLSVGELDLKEKQLGLEDKKRIQGAESRQTQLKIARAFLQYYYRFAQNQESHLLLSLAEQQLGFVESIKDKGAFLEYENARLEQMDAAQAALVSKRRLSQAKRKLSQLVDSLPEEPPVLEGLSGLSFELPELAAKYQGNQKVQKLVHQQALKAIEIKRTGLEGEAELVLGGYQGQSESVRATGANQSGSTSGVYLNLNYQFGAGASEKVQSLKLEYSLGEQELSDLKEEQRDQAKIDYQELVTASQALETQVQQLVVTQQLFEMAKERSQVGRVSALEMGKYKKRLIQAETLLAVAQKNQWESLLVIIEGAEFNLSQWLKRPAQSSTLAK